MNDKALTLEDVGWKPYFQQQLVNHPQSWRPARVIAVQRTGLTIAPAIAPYKEIAVSGRLFVQQVEARPTVGDWILVNPLTGALEALLERSSLIKRLAPSGDVQLIAANIDTAFLVTSCNADFSLARLERYISVVMEADIQPVVVLTKMDTAADPYVYLDQARTLGNDLPIELVDARDMETLTGLVAWCGPGQSIALLGSSGVGKSTLVNTLAGAELQATQAARSDDDKGRHTTTHRSLHVLPSGGVILDSPGMRELQLAEAEQGVVSAFTDIEEMALLCRFNDCAHNNEPGCAVQAAIAAGELDARRLESYLKLLREEQFNRESVAERHARNRQFGRKVKKAMDAASKKRSS